MASGRPERGFAAGDLVLQPFLTLTLNPDPNPDPNPNPNPNPNQVGISGWNAQRLRVKTVQWLQDNGARPMDA